MRTEEKHIGYEPQNLKKRQTLTITLNTTTTIIARVNATHQCQVTGIVTPREHQMCHKILFANSISTVPGKEIHTKIFPLVTDWTLDSTSKIELTPKDEKPVYSQNLPMPINVKADILVELGLMVIYDITNNLPFSKYASPMFAQRTPSGKCRLLEDLRNYNNLIFDDNVNKSHPINKCSDAALHLECKQLLCGLDCSQAYHKWRINDP